MRGRTKRCSRLLQVLFGQSKISSLLKRLGIDSNQSIRLGRHSKPGITMKTNTVGQADELFCGDFEIISPFVDRTIPHEERCVDLETRSRRIHTLWAVHEEYLATEGRILSAVSLRQLESHCKLLEKVTQVAELGELQDFQVMMVLDYLVERGFSSEFQRKTMYSIYEMLFTTFVLSDENDVELRQSLDGCVGVAAACSRMAVELRRERDRLAMPLTIGEIKALLPEAHSAQTELLALDFSRCTFWFLVLMLLSGASESELVGTTLQNVYSDGSNLWIRIGKTATRIPPCAMGLGLLGYLERLRYQEEVKLFPALAKAAGRQLLSRVLGGRRVEDACGRPGGYTLQDIRKTHADRPLVVAALSALHAQVGFLE